jgi:soluble lytic murein transglycosylase-like protein
MAGVLTDARLATRDLQPRPPSPPSNSNSLADVFSRPHIAAFVIVFAILLGAPVVGAQTTRPAPPTPSAPSAQAAYDIARLPGLARIFRDVAATAARLTAEQAAARLFDFDQVVAAVSGRAAPAATMESYREAFAGTRPLTIPVERGTAARDDTAYRLHSLGYSAKEIADIVAGRITRSALDNAQKMLMLGSRPEQVSDFLDREYRRLQAAKDRAEARERERNALTAPRGMAGVPAATEAHVVRYASLYGVDAGLVRAVITCESGWNPEAVSRVGAIGLMQLMPGTARELGVEPRDPQQNVEGGVRYLASLLRLFKTVEHALVAYNAGPGFAARYARGEAALYGETREFVKNVLQQAAR